MTTEPRDPSAQDGTPLVDAGTSQTEGHAPDASSTPASSSAETGANTDAPKSTLDVIRDVTRKDKGSSDPAATPAADKEDGNTPSTEATDKVKTDEKDPPFHTHPRWQEKQREVKELRARVTELEAPAQNFAKIQTFMDRERLDTDIVVQSLQAAALYRNNKEKALEHFRSIVSELEEDLGEKIPQDLQDDVDDGLITADRAKELAKARAKAALAEAETKEVRDREAATQTQTQAQEAVAVMVKAVATWEAAEKGKDPSYAKKQPFIMAAVKASVAQERAKGKTFFTADEVKTILETAKKEVTENLRAVMPARAEIRPPRQNGHRTPSPGGPAADGKKVSTLDIVRNRGARSD